FLNHQDIIQTTIEIQVGLVPLDGLGSCWNKRLQSRRYVHARPIVGFVTGRVEIHSRTKIVRTDKAVVLVLRGWISGGPAACYSPLLSCTTRPFSGCSGRTSCGYNLANASICCAEISTGVLSTNQITPSLHGGAVCDPT